jgi:hypothetical protein
VVPSLVDWLVSVLQARAAKIMGAGLAGGVSLGQNAPLKEGPKDHSYEIVDGEAKARVYDTPVSVESG